MLTYVHIIGTSAIKNPDPPEVIRTEIPLVTDHRHAISSVVQSR